MADKGFVGFHFSNTIISSSKREVKMGAIVLTIPFCVTISKRSSPLNSPINSPLPSTLRRLTTSSNHIFLGFKVDTPFSLSSIRFTVYFVTIFPLEPLPLIRTSAKSISHFSFLILPACLKFTVTTSASPLGFAEK